MAGDFKRAFRLGGSSRSDIRSSIDDELAHHVDLCVDELMDQGWGEDEARREAARQFGDMEQTRAYCSEMQMRRGVVERRSASFEEFWQDIRYAARTLTKAPGYAGLVIVTLAFGIAANTTIFSIMNPYFFRDLPFEQPDELVHITQVDPISGWHMDRMSLPIYEDWQARSRAFEQLGAYTYGGTNITGPEGPEGVNYSTVTANMFEILGTQAFLGRTFTSGEGGPGAEPVTVISHGLWQRRYTGDPSILGRPIMLDGVAHTVIGVMPPDFQFPFGGVRLWVPTRENVAAANRAGSPYLLVGRLNDGWTSAATDEELTGIQRQLSEQYPDADGQWAGVTVLPIRQALNFAWDILKVGFSVLLGAVAFVLAIACVNVASLTLARGSGRAREVAVRAAMGARRGRLVRQLLTESLILAVAGGVVGVGLVGPVIPEDLFKSGDINVDRTVLLFSSLVTLATPLLFGLFPALAATRRDLTGVLKEGSKGSGGIAAARGRRVLVVAQIAMAVLLITGAGLMLRSFSSVQQLDLGFDPDRVLTVNVSPPASDYPSEELDQYVERAIAELGAIPGVTHASATLFLPLNNESSLWQFAPPEAAGTPAAEWPTAIANRPYPGYFATMGIDLVEGRDFQRSDDRSAAPVAIINDALASRYWPGSSALGRTLLVGDPAAPVSATIVGVVRGVLHEALNGDVGRPQIYRPALQASFRRHFLVARTDGDPATIVTPVREGLMALDPDLPVSVGRMSDIVSQSQLQWSLGSGFTAVFGLGALLLATLGIYGLVSFSVAQRERELGVRIALGATRADIRRVVVGDGMRLTAIGLGVGIAAAVGMGQLIAGTLFGVTPFDPVTLIGVVVLFTAVSGAASYIPAARASRTDPIGVLKAE